MDKMKREVIIKEAFFGTPEHAQELELRNEVLRKPLGLDLYAQDLASEKSCIRIAAFLPGQPLEDKTQGSEAQEPGISESVSLSYDFLAPEALAFISQPLLAGPSSPAPLVGCLLLFPLDQPAFWQLKQMAVREDCRELAIGRRMLEFAEKLILEKEKSPAGQNKQRAFRFILNARKSALGFYEKSGYKIVSEEFMELDIPHYRMEKIID